MWEINLDEIKFVHPMKLVSPKDKGSEVLKN